MKIYELPDGRFMGVFTADMYVDLVAQIARTAKSENATVDQMSTVVPTLSNTLYHSEFKQYLTCSVIFRRLKKNNKLKK